MMTKNRLWKILAAGVAFASISGTATAADPTPYEAFMQSADAGFFTVSNLWILICAAFVFIMHLGFATLESGLTQSKNTVNVLFKNVFILCIGVVAYALWGFNAMYPVDFNGFIAAGFPIANGFAGEAVAANLTSAYGDGSQYTYWTDFIFQAMFAATAATIVGGAVAERIKLSSFMVYGTLLVAFLYPITGSWKWGEGWLDANGFWDFAGSSLVHGFGGFSALAAVMVLGARKGKYLENGKIRPILGHSMPLATIGTFVLFFGWFGFNGGSVLSADPAAVSWVFVTTALSACCGGLGGTFLSWVLLRKPDISMALNGILAGLVGITAGADLISPFAAMGVGFLSGIIVVLAVLFFDKMKIDDPVGAISVHGVCGIWGTLSVAIFGGAAAAEAGVTFLWQLIGTLSVCAFAFVGSFALFSLVKVLMGVRVSEEEERGGLDIGEHGQEAYPDFQPSTK